MRRRLIKLDRKWPSAFYTHIYEKTQKKLAVLSSATGKKKTFFLYQSDE